MFEFLKKNAAMAMASVALVLSGCNSFTDMRAPPNIYADSGSVAETALTTIKAFGAAQDTIITVCGPALPDTVEGDACAKIIPVEQTLRPAVAAAGQIGAEYADIDARIRELGPKAPAEWLLAAAEVASRLSAAYDPIRADVDDFLGNVGALN